MMSFVQSNCIMSNSHSYDVQSDFPAPVTVSFIKGSGSKQNNKSCMERKVTLFTSCDSDAMADAVEARQFEIACERKKRKIAATYLKMRMKKASGTQKSYTVSVDQALEIIDDRKKSIRAKLLLKKDNFLTQEEEQDIHTRADMYAISATPDPTYFLLPEEGTSCSYEHVCTSNSMVDNPSDVSPPRKKKRRNYGNTVCYVSFHNHEDVFDNTKMLPIGTRLIKPSTKLVELVANAINGSPDGLLQVQQIYTYLQNRYPFFRYMDRVAINSWRSSIRHALYQKWFRKIRFELTFISSKGCYWAINHKHTPKEWSLPEPSMGAVELEFYADVLAAEEEEETCKLADIAQRFMSDIDTCEIGLTDNDGSDVEEPRPVMLLMDKQAASQSDGGHGHHIPLPVREPDPILANCAADWENDDLDLSSNESGHGTMTPIRSPPYLHIGHSLLSQDGNVDDHDFLINTPVKNSRYSLKPCSAKPSSIALNKTPASSTRALRDSNISPIGHWSPNWDDYGSYIMSPQNLSSQKLVLGLPGGQMSEFSTEQNMTVQQDSEADDNGEVTMLDFTGAPSASFLYGHDDCESGSCDFEVIAEF